MCSCTDMRQDAIHQQNLNSYLISTAQFDSCISVLLLLYVSPRIKSATCEKYGCDLPRNTLVRWKSVLKEEGLMHLPLGINMSSADWSGSLANAFHDATTTLSLNPYWLTCCKYTPKVIFTDQTKLLSELQKI